MMLKNTGKRRFPKETGGESAQIKSTFLNRSGINRIALIFCLGLFSAGCVFPPIFKTPSQIAQESKGDGRQGRERSRFTIKDKSCNENKECPDLCEIVFNRRTERDDCEERTVSEVREFKRIHYFLQGKNAEGSNWVSDREGYFGNLNRIVAEDLEDMVSISENPATLARLLDSTESTWTSPRQTRPAFASERKPIFRNWIANNQDIAEIFRDEDEDFAVFEAIFGDDCSAVNSALRTDGYIEKPDGNSHSPGRIAVRAGNRDFLQWIHDYLSTISGATPPDPKTLINHNGPPSNDDWCNPLYR